MRTIADIRLTCADSLHQALERLRHQHDLKTMDVQNGNGEDFGSVELVAHTLTDGSEVYSLRFFLHEKYQ